MLRLILASASPQRRKILSALEVPFEVVPSEVDEHLCEERDPATRAACLAEDKARDVQRKFPEAFILGCDTLVVAPDGTLLEKPRVADEAREMLRKQSGGVSTVHSALCLLTSSNVHRGISSSHVSFRTLSDQEMEWWLSMGLWEGRSGAFQIEDRGQLLIERIEGDYSGIVGLPVSLLGQLLREAGLDVFPSLPPGEEPVLSLSKY